MGSAGDCPVLGVLIFWPISWIILENIEFLAKVLDFLLILLKFLDFLTRYWQLLLLNNSRITKIRAKNARSFHCKTEENHSFFINKKLGYKYFSGQVLSNMKIGFSIILKQKRKVFRRADCGCFHANGKPIHCGKAEVFLRATCSAFGSVISVSS